MDAPGASFDAARARAFVLAQTAVLPVPHVPEIRLHQADEAHDLWLRTEEELAAIGIEPPFWAFAWAGGQALARYVLDHPETVLGAEVLDFASGSGLVACAAAMAGAAHVLAVDVDPFAGEAMRLNAELNGVALGVLVADLVGTGIGAEVVLAGDVFFDRGMATTVAPWLARLAGEGRTVLVGDPGRAYLPKSRLEHLATYEVPVTRALEDAEIKHTSVWCWRG
ncbi:class I SAM-dependent methyltransferase [Aureimonas leprariae]|uniref:Methyltransferase n=1 Tax=Plantimonas leprariae TaxID=2615207 RepID=A0A7V7PRM2_9HYPH|nr:methyltransferase [Aureimonas leprariae]KAB0681453.1 methyltransferase [Aureimonas leprariae]